MGKKRGKLARTERGPSSWRALRLLAAYVRPHAWALVGVSVGLVVASVLGLLNLLLLKPAVEILRPDEQARRVLVQQIRAPDGAVFELRLRDDGRRPDEQAADGVYSAFMPPQWGQTGVVTVELPRERAAVTSKQVRALQPLDRAWGGLIAPIKSALTTAEQWLKRQALYSRWWALWIVAATMLLLSVLKGAIESGCQYLLASACYRMVGSMHEDLFRRVIAQDYLFFLGHSTGYLESRIQSDVATLRRTVETVLRHGFQAPFQMLFLAVLLLSLNFSLTLIVLAVAAVAALPLLYLSREIRWVLRETKRQADRQAAGLEESLRNFPVVKFFQSEPVEIEKFAHRNRQLLRCYLRNRLAQFGSAPVMQLAAATGRSAIILAGGYLVLGGQMEFSSLVVYLVALTRFYAPGRALSRVGTTWPTLTVAAERMAAILEMQPAIVEADGAAPLGQVREAIEFRNVSFSYGNQSPSGAQVFGRADSLHGASEALEDVSFRVPVGRVVALVGPSGAGKTTIVCLLARLFDPTSGAILIDGTDIRRYQLADLRRAIATVTQETILFNDTVAHNIAYPDPKPDMARVAEAARAAHAHDFIMSLDGAAGYETIIGQGGQRLSGGQRQRIAIARAFYRDPQILIFDEATSSLDEKSQALVQDAIANLFRGRTVLIIAHRLSTVRRADEILVLNKGRLIERGTHNELLDRDGFYASLYRISQGNDLLKDEGGRMKDEC